MASRADFRQRQEGKMGIKLSPRQIQLMNMLELSTLALQDRIKKEIEQNPVLDADLPESFASTKELAQSTGKENSDSEEYINEDEGYDYLYYSNSKPQTNFYENRLKTTQTLQEHLLWQFSLLSVSEKERKIAENIIGNIDSNGYLRREISFIANDIAIYSAIEVSAQEVQEVLRQIWRLDPIASGSRDLQECIEIQLELLCEKELAASASAPAASLAVQPSGRLQDIKNAQKINQNCFQELANKAYGKISQKLGLTQEQIQRAVKIIKSLNPKPGSAFSQDRDELARQIMPDFTLFWDADNNLQLSINAANAPQLCIAKEYEGLGVATGAQEASAAIGAQEAAAEPRLAVEVADEKLAASAAKAAKAAKSAEKTQKHLNNYLKKNLNSAYAFIDLVKQRHETLLAVVSKIVEVQKEFLLTGDPSRFKPLKLKDIAQATAYDISTVSRAVSGKYLQSPYAIIAIKDLFSNSLQDQNGENVSTKEIREKIKLLIESEDPQKPLQDEEISSILAKDGFKLARRTVAKYRNLENIPIAKLRKKA